MFVFVVFGCYWGLFGLICCLAGGCGFLLGLVDCGCFGIWLILFAGWTSLRSLVGYLVCWRMFLRVCDCLLCGGLVCLVSMVICYLCLRG